jgi:hypothetical protein
MGVQFIVDYVVALAGLGVGGVAGFLVALGAGRAPAWDARVTLPLVLAAGAAHLALIPVVETQRQVMFGLYFLAMGAVFAAGLIGVAAWRIGAIVFPAGSIVAYFYFAFIAHQADVVGLIVKAVELAVIITAAAGFAIKRGDATDARSSLA